MGKLEEENRKNTRRTKIQEAILLTIASGGRLGAKLITKRVIEYMLGIEDSSPPRRSEIVQSAASRLRRRGFVVFKDKQYSLTQAGEKLLKDWQLSNYRIKRPKKWDGKWRIFIYDISEKKRVLRRQIANIFSEAGFKRLQDSVWVYPYDCEDVIGLLKTDFGIGKELLYVIADQIENDKYLRMDFDLI